MVTNGDEYREILARIEMLRSELVVGRRDREPEKIPLIDPTANVLSLVSAESRRQDDLRMAYKERQDDLVMSYKERSDDLRRMKEICDKETDELREQLRAAESKRIDAIRAVDVAAVVTASDRTAQQATVLANQVASSAETLRSLVATTAEQVAKNLSNISTQLADRLTQLEKSQYQIGGRDVQRGEERGQSNINRQLLIFILVAVVGWGLTVLFFALRTGALPK